MNFYNKKEKVKQRLIILSIGSDKSMINDVKIEYENKNQNLKTKKAQ